MTSTKAARLHDFGSGSETMCIETVNVVEPGPTEVLVSILASPVHPADLNVIEGKYGKLPSLPAILGNESCGRVEQVGDQVSTIRVGDLVAVMEPGNWCQSRVTAASNVIVLPSEIDPLQACMLVINPLSAWAMIHLRGTPETGAWIAQNASNSAVGRCVIQIARELGLHTLNLVRREELRTELIGLGADIVHADPEQFIKTALPLSSRPALGLNAVGGAAALTIANAVADGGDIVTYGAMGRQPLKIPNGMLIFRGLNFRGFWLRSWLSETHPTERDRVLLLLADWMQTGRLTMPVGLTFPLARVNNAIAEAARSGRSGKVIICPQSD
jgi:trans-2-enoyl-CoA reductase